MLRAPFPYFGGKRRWAELIWERFGKPDRYLEPFAGSLAVLLACPYPAPMEIVCDKDGFICNFWRALKGAPDEVAEWADWPTCHHDLTARKRWLSARAEGLEDRLKGDPDYYDAKVAGWWVWCRAHSIGSRCPHDQDWIPSIGPVPGGAGVSKQRLTLPGPIHRWFDALSARLEHTIVLARDWTAALSPTVTGTTGAAPNANVCVFLDPPYRTTAGKFYGAGADSDPAVESYLWAIEHGAKMRIAYAFLEGDFEVPEGWDVEFASLAGYRIGRNADEAKRDAVMFSPKCNTPKQEGLF